MRKRGNLKMRLLSIMMAATLAVTGFPASGLSMEASAAGTTGSGNALKAIGINSDVAPEGFDENDTEFNPYGKKTVVGTVSDEVYVAQIGEKGSALIGNERVKPTGTNYSYENSSGHTGGKYLLTYKDNIAYDGDGKSYMNHSYIGEIAVSGDTKADLAKSALSSQGYTVIDKDLNDDAGGDYVYIGYKTTKNPREALTNIIIAIYKNGEQANLPGTLTYQGKSYTRATAYGRDVFKNANGDLNCMTKKHNEHLYAYYTKDVDSGSYNDLLESLTVDGSKNEEDGVRGVRYSASNLESGDIYKCADLNTGAAGDDIYMHMGKVNAKFADVEGTVSTNANPDVVNNASMNKTAGGNFDGNTEGKKSQFAMVSSTSEGGLNLSVVDAVS